MKTDAADIGEKGRTLQLWALSTLLLSLLCVVSTMYQAGSDDQWWHMLTGKVILQTGHVPVADLFSFTHQGAAWVNWEWLPGVFMYQLYHALGVPGLFIFRMACLLGTLLLLFSLTRRAGHPRWTSAGVAAGFAILALLLLSLQNRIADRPYMLGYLLLAGVYALVGLRHAPERARMAYLMGLPPVYVLWSISHPSWLLGLAVAAAIIADDVLVSLRGGVGLPQTLRKYAPDAAAVALAAVIIGFIHGFGGYFGSMGDIFHTRLLSEWRPLWAVFSFAQPNYPAFALLTLLWFGITALRWRKIRPFHSLVMIGLLVYAVKYYRFSAVFSICAAADLLRITAESRLTRLQQPHRPVALMLATAILILPLLYLRPAGSMEMGLSVDRQGVPVDLADFMQREHIGGNLICTSLGCHSYMAYRLWPQVHIFIDGRVPQVFSGNFLQEYAQAGEGDNLERMLEKYPITLVGLDRAVQNPTNTYLAGVMLSRPDFTLLYFDEVSALFAAGGDKAAGPLPEGFRLLNPWRLSADDLYAAVQNDNGAQLLREVALLKQRTSHSRVSADIIRWLLGLPDLPPEVKQSITGILAAP